MRFVRAFGGGLLAFAFVACSTDPAINTPGGPAPDNGTGPGGTSGGGGTSGSSSGIPSGGPVFKIPDGGTGPASGTGGAGGTGGVKGGGACGLKDYKLDRLPPEILLVLDRSGSMNTKVPGSANTRWVEVTAAIDETVKQTENGVFWGLKLFPSDAGGCMVTDPVEIEVAATNYASVGARIMMTKPGGGAQGGTPTSLAVANAMKYMQSRAASKNPKYLLLATDGEPNCKGGTTNSNDAPGSVAAVAAAAAAGYHTFVVGIATAGTAANTVLDDMAVAGSEPRATAPKYYAVANKQDLAAALALITARVSTCVFPLDQTPPSLDDVAVNVDGKRILRDKTQANGWNYGPAMKTIELFGPACEGLKAGAATDVKIIFGCPGMVIP